MQHLQSVNFNQSINLPSNLIELNLDFSSDNNWQLDLLEGNQGFVINIHYQNNQILVKNSLNEVIDKAFIKRYTLARNICRYLLRHNKY